MTRGARSALWLLLATVGAVLIIVCVNVGNLMLVRTTGRYREAGVRMALGASRSQLFRLVLTEALALVVIGGGFGLALADAGLRGFAAWAPVGLPRLEEVQIDWRVLTFAGVAVAFSTLVCGLFPAWRLARIEPQECLKAASATSTEPRGKLRVREILVSVEVGLSTVLLIVGGLLLLSFFRVMRAEKGFAVAHVITQDVSFLNPKYARGNRRRFVEEAVEKLARIPGVQAAGAVNRLPLRGEDWVDGLRDPDQPARPMEQAAVANFRFVAPHYFEAIGIPLKQGRFLDQSDRDRPTAVISERAAQYLWPGENPLGRHVRGAATPQRLPLEVVGIVGEVRAGGMEQSPPMIVYEHYWRMQPVGHVLRATHGVRTCADRRRSPQDLFVSAPEMALPPARTMQQIVEETVAARRFQTYLALAFASSALLLASLGIYGVVSFTVARRTSEMGIRIALGARRRQLIGMILRQVCARLWPVLRLASQRHWP